MIVLVINKSFLNFFHTIFIDKSIKILFHGFIQNLSNVMSGNIQVIGYIFDRQFRIHVWLFRLHKMLQPCAVIFC